MRHDTVNCGAILHFPSEVTRVRGPRRVDRLVRGEGSQSRRLGPIRSGRGSCGHRGSPELGRAGQRVGVVKRLLVEADPLKLLSL